MFDFQSLIFRQAAHWSEATSLVMLCIGLLYVLQGFRFARLLLPIICAAGGLGLGIILAGFAGFPGMFAMLIAAIFGIIGLCSFRWSIIVSSTVTFGLLTQYLGRQCGLRPDLSLIFGLIGMGVGIAMFWLYRRQLPMIVTILAGSKLLVIGFVGLALKFAPSLGSTLVDWSERLPLMMPVLLIMLWTLGYSVQANARQGELQTGGSPDVRELESS